MGVKIEKDKIYTLLEAAEIMNLHPETLRKKARKRIIAHIQESEKSGIYFKGAQILAYFDKNLINNINTMQ